MTVLAALLGSALGAGVLLIASAFLTPRRAAPTAQRSQFAARLEDRLASAGLPTVTPGLFIAVSGLIGLAVAAILGALTGVPALVAVGFCGAAVAPWLIAGARARARTRAHRALWPEVVDHLVAAVRAGQPLPDALASLATAGPAPFRSAFALFEQRWRETGTVSAALDDVKARFADPTADRLFEILRMSRQVGGTELPAVLRETALHLRQDLAVRAEAEARQSWVTSSAKLGVAAPWIVLLLLTLEPHAGAAFATPAGGLLIVVAVAVCVVAYRLMIAVGRLPEDRRWFR